MNSYGKIYNLGHKAVADLLNGQVTVEEKIDGSQFSFKVDGATGKMIFRSRGKEMHPESPEKMFAEGVAALLEMQNRFVPGWTYRGEYLQKPKHNALTYSRVPAAHVIIFDIDAGDQQYLTADEKQREARRIGMECVPILYEGDGALLTASSIEEWLKQDSILGGAKIEGVVIKNYARFGIDGKVLMGKHVSEAFKEVHKKAWGEANPKGGDIIAILAAGLGTEPRWNKAIQHAAENGTLQNAPQDIGPLLAAIKQDVAEEEKETIKDHLWDWAWPHIQRQMTSRFPAWYKQQLTEKQFAGGESNVPAAG